jgi:U3 small nucleolar RNA-associated protein 22
LSKTHKITIPFPDPKPDNNVAYKLAYAPPEDINVVGSYPLRTIVENENRIGVDMVVTMPQSLLQKKDYLNYRYIYKRAYYVSCIAAGVQDSMTDAYTVAFEYLGDNHLQPVLKLTPGMFGRSIFSRT